MANATGADGQLLSLGEALSMAFIVVVAGNDLETIYGKKPNFYGNLVVQELDHTFQGQPVYVLYGHLSQVNVEVGQHLQPGDVLGRVGMRLVGFAGWGLLGIVLVVLGAAWVLRFSWGPLAEGLGARIDALLQSRRARREVAIDLAEGRRAARAREAEVLIVDTAGRLHSNFNLMAELVKMRDVLRKAIPDAPHETLLVLDGTTGQNALTQAKKFQEAIAVTGVVVTKLDSTAKGGMLFAIQQELGLPVHYIGIGESMYDLVFFNPTTFVDSLFENGNEE